MRKTVGGFGFMALWAIAALAGGEREARACGACFHEAPTPAQPQTESTIVSDHRMVFSISEKQTVLWDQVRYSGNPREFAWVLPVRPGTKIELSHNEWIAALDAATQPRITEPPPKPLGGFAGAGGPYGGGYGGGADGEGCGCPGSSDRSTASYAAGAADGSASPGSLADAGPPPVQVIDQEVVGPYETVTVRSDQPKAMEQWLRDHGYAIPDSVIPILDAYGAAKLDFVALRLRPGQGVQAMQPVRVVSPGADPTLPLRMVAAGVGANVGLTLYVIGEGRYRPQNFPESVVDDKLLVWNTQTSRSNYQQLSALVMGQADGRTWLTEYASKPVTTGGQPIPGAASLYDVYYGTCDGRLRNAPPPTPPHPDAGGDDAGAAGDAGLPGADGGVDAGSGQTTTPTPGLCRYGDELCCDFDDLEVAAFGLHRQDIWLTRLRAELPASALGTDLRLEPHPQQTTVSNQHQAKLPPGSGDGGTASVAPRKRSPLGTGIVVVGATILVARILRRRRSAR